MKKIFFTIIAFCLVGSLAAQPAKRRTEDKSSLRTSAANRNSRTERAQQVSDRAALMFPTAVDVPDDPSWRRDIYRSLDLEKDENAPLYYPVQPEGKSMNLFTLLFKLLNAGRVPAYKHDLNTGREDFRQTESSRLDFEEMLRNYSIFYEGSGSSVKVEDSDIPSAEVKAFYIKESSYYDQNTATYHSRVVALCPLINMGGWGDGDSRKSPMFWVKYDDVKTYLSKYLVMTSNINNAAKMSIDDFFSTNHYKGDIYMITNMQGKSLAQMVDPSDSTGNDSMKSLQKKIEKEMTDFEEHIWKTPVDSLELARKDSIAALEAAKMKKNKGAVAASTTRRGATSVAEKKEGTSSQKKEKEGRSSSSASSGPRVSVRRQRH